MSLNMILAGGIGAVVGGVIGHVKLRQAFPGVVLGAAAAMVAIYFLGAGPASSVASVTTDKFESEVLNATQPVLVDFYSDSCGPCRKLAPTIEELAEEYNGRIKVVKFDVMAGPALAGEYEIRGIPAVMLFVNGEVVETLVGLQPKENYRSAIDAVLAGQP